MTGEISPVFYGLYFMDFAYNANMHRIIFAFLLAGCVFVSPKMELSGLQSVNGDYNIAYWARDTDNINPVHIYIEGDGHAFDAQLKPTADPTPRGAFVRNMAMNDTAPNVAYIARPCQFITSPACNSTDWTSGRFSEKLVSEMADAVRWIARGRPIVLIGYSGGAMMSGLVIENNPDLDIRQWITIAGIINHSDWTDYLGDTPLYDSMNLRVLPHVSARHYIAQSDSVVPRYLSVKWLGTENLITISGATHDKFPGLNIDFNY